jgi:hypothetical protein
MCRTRGILKDRVRKKKRLTLRKRLKIIIGTVTLSVKKLGAAGRLLAKESGGRNLTQDNFGGAAQCIDVD